MVLWAIPWPLDRFFEVFLLWCVFQVSGFVVYGCQGEVFLVNGGPMHSLWVFLNPPPIYWWCCELFCGPWPLFFEVFLLWCVFQVSGFVVYGCQGEAFLVNGGHHIHSLWVFLNPPPIYWWCCESFHSPWPLFLWSFCCNVYTMDLNKMAVGMKILRDSSKHPMQTKRLQLNT